MKVLVTGGAGYIGSHCVHQLINREHDVIVIDNLQTGYKQAIHKDAMFYQGDIRDLDFLREIFSKETIDVVIHFAANSLVGVSMKEPLEYYNNNVHGTECLLKVMNEFDVKKIVFSSTAAVFGEVEKMPIVETNDTKPTNTYGETKLAMEKMMKWADVAYGIKYIALRYFNVAGAIDGGMIGESHNPETHLIPIILQVALGKRDYISVFGNDYDTIDGTCVRDYIHVIDLVEAHILAMNSLIDGCESNVFNLGNGEGFTVLQMIEAARKVTNHSIPIKEDNRRAGDPAKLIASSEKITNILGWNAKYNDVEKIIASAWEFHQKYPDGFSKE